MSEPEFRGRVGHYRICFAGEYLPVTAEFDVMFSSVAEAERFRDFVMSHVKLRNPDPPPPPEG